MGMVVRLTVAKLAAGLEYSVGTKETPGDPWVLFCADTLEREIMVLATSDEYGPRVAGKEEKG